MMRATKYVMIGCVFLLLNFLGHPIESKVVGWDYCTEEGHPLVLYVYKFGWPIPGVMANQIWGCLSTPNQWFEFSWPGIIGTTVFWIVAIWIIGTYWPVSAREEICPRCRNRFWYFHGDMAVECPCVEKEDKANA